MNDPITELLTRGRADVDTDRLRDEATLLAASVRSTAPHRRPRRRLAIGLAAVLVAVPTTAVAYEYGARTGLFGDPSRSTEEPDRSEWLDMCAPDYAGIIASHRPGADAALPTGLDWSMGVRHVQAMTADACATGSGGRLQEIGIDRALNYWAQCAWLREGVAAIDAGSGERRKDAADALRHYADTEVNHVTDGGGIVEQDLAVADAVGRGDAGPARKQVSLNCGQFGVAR